MWPQISFSIKYFFEMLSSKDKLVSLEPEQQTPGKVYKHPEPAHCAGEPGAVPFVYSVHVPDQKMTQVL